MLTPDETEILKNATGWISTCLLALLYIPQTITVYAKRDSRGLTWIFLIVGMFLTTDTIIYGSLLGEIPLIVANVIASICMIFLMIAKCVWPPSDPMEIIEINNDNNKIQV